MKKLLAIVMAAAMIMSLGACAKKEKPAETAVAETAAETVEPFTQAQETQTQTVAETAAETAAETLAAAETAAEDKTAADENPVLVHPVITENGQTAQREDNTMAYTLTWGAVTLREDDAKLYPGLEGSLEELNAATKETVLADVDRFMETISEAKADGRELQELVNKTTAHAVRSDSNYFSVQTDTFVDYGGAHPGTLIQGNNYDTKTGKELLIGDIIKDREKLLEIIKAQLLENYQPEEFFDLDTDIEKYQLDIKTSDPDDTKRAFTWILGYDSVVIIFNQYDIAPYAAGMMIVEIKFADHPELFAKGVEYTPESYAVITEDSYDDAGYHYIKSNVKTKNGSFIWKLKFMDDDETSYFIYNEGSSKSIAEIPAGGTETNEATEPENTRDGYNYSQRVTTDEQVVDPYDFKTTSFDRASGKHVTKHYTIDDNGIPVEK